MPFTPHRIWVRLYVIWVLGSREDVDPVTVKVSWLARFLGCEAVTIGRTIHTKKPEIVVYPDTYVRLLRHELTHVKQQAGRFKVWWIVRYLVSRRFRETMEAEATAAESARYPIFRVGWP